MGKNDVIFKFITPAIVKVCMYEATDIRRQVSCAQDSIIARGKLVSRGNAKNAGYVLYRQHIPIALIEAKASTVPLPPASSIC